LTATFDALTGAGIPRRAAASLTGMPRASMDRAARRDAFWATPAVPPQPAPPANQLTAAERTRVLSLKVSSARRCATEVYPQAEVSVELWSPIVPRGFRNRLADSGADLVVNETFTSRVEKLLDYARASTKLTAEPAFRMLRTLTHLRRSRATDGEQPLSTARL
jgi:hypothetical protein